MILALLAACGGGKPAPAAPVNRAEPVVEEAIAHNEPMTVRLMSEAAGDPAATRFLHVLQAGDAGSDAFSPVLLRSEDGQWEGALAGDTAVLFPQATSAGLTVSLRYTAPAATAVHLITGLAPNAGYDVELEPTDGGTVVSIQPGAALQADEGGVLVIR
jgi:hypothetical protein